jgi:hypothetical protein
MFTRHRLGPTNKLDCPHAMGTNAFSRIMIPRLPLRLRSGLRQRRDFCSGLRRPLGASTFCCYHRPIRLLRCAQSLRAGSIRLLRCAQSLRAGSGCLPRTQADESSSQDGSSHPKIAKSAILGWGTRGAASGFTFTDTSSCRSMFTCWSANHSGIRPAVELPHSSQKTA